MSIWDYTPKLDIWTGVMVGAGLIAAPVVLPIVAGMVRPVIKGVVNGVIAVYVTGRDLISDTLEEVRSEVRD